MGGKPGFGAGLLARPAPDDLISPFAETLGDGVSIESCHREFREQLFSPQHTYTMMPGAEALAQPCRGPQSFTQERRRGPEVVTFCLQQVSGKSGLFLGKCKS